MILGAGEGRRLRPLTTALPKPMLTVLDVPVIDHLIERVSVLGDIPIYVNLHYQADVLARHLGKMDRANVRWRTEPVLTGPAGALRLFGPELAEHTTVLVLSGDVIFSDALAELVSAHLASGAELTFAVTAVNDAHRYGVLTLGTGDRVLEAREKPDVPSHEQHWISAGIYCLDSTLLADIPPDRVFDFAADLAPALITSGRHVQAHRLRGYWNDLGRPEALRQANLDAVAGLLGHTPHPPALLDGHVRMEGPVHVGEGIQVGSGTFVIGPAVLGAGSVIGAGCWIQNSVLLPGTRLEAGTILIDALAGHRHAP